MAFNENDKDFIEEQLTAFGEVRSKRMFGGVGFFKNDLMFAMIGGGKFRLKADETTIPDFEAHGMQPLYLDKYPNKPPMPYWEVPVSVLEDRDELAQWCAKAYAIAVKKKKK